MSRVPLVCTPTMQTMSFGVTQPPVMPFCTAPSAMYFAEAIPALSTTPATKASAAKRFFFFPVMIGRSLSFWSWWLAPLLPCHNFSLLLLRLSERTSGKAFAGFARERLISHRQQQPCRENP